MSGGLKPSGLMSGGLKSYDREQSDVARRHIKHVDTAWASGRHRGKAHVKDATSPCDKTLVLIS